MYLFLGNETCVNYKDIIGIFDLDTSTVSIHTRNYLNKAEKCKKTEYVNKYELPKSFVVTKEKIYITPISSATLLKRINFFQENA